MSRTPISPDLVHRNPAEQAQRIDDTMDRLIEFVPEDLCRALVYESELQDAFEQRHEVTVEKSVPRLLQRELKGLPKYARREAQSMIRGLKKLAGRTNDEAFGVFPDSAEVTEKTEQIREFVAHGWLNTVWFALPKQATGGRMKLAEELVPDALCELTRPGLEGWHNMPLLNTECFVGKAFAQILYRAFATRLAYAVEKAGVNGIPIYCGGDEVRIKKDTDGYYAHVIPSK